MIKDHTVIGNDDQSRAKTDKLEWGNVLEVLWYGGYFLLTIVNNNNNDDNW